MADAFTPAEVVTVKTDEDGNNVVIDVTPLKLLYLGVDGEGNQIVSEDSSVDGVDVDQSLPIKTLYLRNMIITCNKSIKMP